MMGRANYPPRGGPKPYRTTCADCGAALQTRGKGHPRLELDRPLREHDCNQNPTTPEPTTMTDPDDFLGTNEPPRDGYGRPLITPVDGGDPIPYTRVSTFADTLSDAGGLVTWKGRMAARGIAISEDLAAMVAGLTWSDLTDKKARKKADYAANKLLDGYIEQAMSRVTDAAAYGTAVHSFTEPNASPFVPARMQADVAGYHDTLAAHGVTCVEAETFVVNDRWRVAGTLDGIFDIPGIGLVVGDKKTGDIHPPEVAIQVCCYAGSSRYDWTTGARGDLGVRTDVGLLIHIPRGQGQTRLYLLDLTAAERACGAAAWVREWRKRDDLLSDLTPFSAAAVAS